MTLIFTLLPHCRLPGCWSVARQHGRLVRVAEQGASGFSSCTRLGTRSAGRPGTSPAGPAVPQQLSTEFSFTDRGTTVTLNSTLDYAADGRPTHFTLGGQTSRMSTVSLDVTLFGDSARIREDSTTTTVLAKNAFPARGYAPMAIQQAFMREWLRRGRPARFQLVPDATLEITARGTDTIHVADRSLILQRYSVAGLIWGRETLWLDGRGDLIAVATVDAEFDPVQAVKEGLESATGTFVKLAAADAIAALSGSSGKSGRPDTLIAIVGRYAHRRHRCAAGTRRHRGGRRHEDHCRGTSHRYPGPAGRARDQRDRRHHHARPLGDARPLRPGRVGTHLPRLRRHHRPRRRQPVRVPARRAPGPQQRQGRRPAPPLRRHHRWRGPVRYRPRPRRHAAAGRRVGAPLSRCRLRADQDLQQHHRLGAPLPSPPRPTRSA